MISVDRSPGERFSPTWKRKLNETRRHSRKSTKPARLRVIQRQPREGSCRVPHLSFGSTGYTTTTAILVGLAPGPRILFAPNIPWSNFLPGCRMSARTATNSDAVVRGNIDAKPKGRFPEEPAIISVRRCALFGVVVLS